jgi:dienelactone hydrolase
MHDASTVLTANRPRASFHELTLFGRQRRSLLRLGGSIALAGAPALRAHAAGGIYDFQWMDAARQRHVPARLYLPGGDGPVPLVVYSHGLGSSSQGHGWFGQQLARQGIASLHPQHVGSDRQLWSGNIFGTVGRLRGAANEAEAIARAHDVRFALDTILSGEFAGRIDGTRVVAAGHSFGANTTLLASGATVEREGKVVPLHDPRIRAAIAISAPPFHGEPLPQKILRALTVPSLHVTCTNDVIRIPGYYSDARDRVAVYDATGSARKWLAVFEGGSHSAFTDWSGATGANQQLKVATSSLVVAFIAAVVGDDTAAMASWRERHLALLARFSAAGV